MKAVHLLELLALLLPVWASPSQYCRLGLDSGSVDFCAAVATYHNHSSSSHDLYVSLRVRRPASHAALGWTAVGIGHRMQGALMFILYGDPSASPVLSVRTTTAPEMHSAPLGITAPLHIRVARAAWTPGSANVGSWTADVSLVCYACTAWEGDAIAAESDSLPWIWAWNKDQDMQPYDADKALRHHDLVAGTGFGHFYVNMKSAETHHANEAMPSISILINISTSERPIPTSPPDSSPVSLLHALAERPLVHVHGFLMCVAFFILFPLGAWSIRSGRPDSFARHWRLQVSALVIALTGACVAINMTAGDGVLASPHQKMGAGISIGLLVQVVLGWRHHVDFVRLRRRTPISYAHITLGFVILLAGWANVLSGLELFGAPSLAVSLVAGLATVEFAFIAVWSCLAARRRGKAGEEPKETPESSAAYFALQDMNGLDSDEDGEHGRGRREEESGLMRTL